MSSDKTLALGSKDRARVATTEHLAEAGAGGVPVLIEQLADPSWAVRRGVVSALARMGGAAIPGLCEALRTRRDNEARIAAVVDALVASTGDVEGAIFALAEDPNSAVVYDVAQILGRRRSGPGVPLLRRLTTHADDNVAVAAVEALGQVGGRSAVTALIAATRSGNFFRTFPAIDVLGRSGDPEAVPPLIGLLQEPVYASEAVRALGHSGDARAVSPLVDLFLRPGDLLIRPTAVALSQIHAALVLRLGRSEVVADTLRATPLPTGLARRIARAVRGANEQERVALCRILGWVGGEDAISSLLTLLDEELGVAQAAATALAEIGKAADAQIVAAVRGGSSRQRLAVLPHISRRASAAADLVACLEDPDPAVRAVTCEALGRTTDPQALPALFRHLGDADLRVGQAALAAIQSMGSPQTELLALEASHSADAKVRRAALRIIAYFGYPRGLDALLLALGDADERLRDAAIFGLPFIEDSRALEALLEASRHPQPGTRAAAMRALGQSSLDARVQARLRAGLADPDAWVRYFAVQSLAKLKDEGSADAVIALLDDPAGQVRVAVVDGLAFLNTERAAQALARATGSTDPDVQRAALLGLGIARRPESLPLLLEAVQAKVPATRLVALSALAEFDAPEVAAALIEAARDPEPSVRTAAIGFLGARKGVPATQLLVGLLSEQPIRELVMASLSTQTEGRVKGLMAALATADDDLAILLVQALSRLQRPEGTAALFEALRSAGAPGRRAAAHALAAMDTPTARQALERASREDPDPEVRRLCALTLVP